MASNTISKLFKIKQNKNKHERRNYNHSTYYKIIDNILQKSTVILSCLKGLNINLYSIKIISIMFIALVFLQLVLNFIETYLKSNK